MPTSPWDDERVWRAFAKWRWVPPSAKRIVNDEYELAVTPGAPEVSYAYGFRVPDASRVESVLERLREDVTRAGGTGVKVQVTPFSEPKDLAERLLRRGYVPADEAEALVWELRDGTGAAHLPPFPPPPGIEIREARTDEEHDDFRAVARPVFHETEAPPEVIASFRLARRKTIAETGHSPYFVAYEGRTPVGCAGMDVGGEVAHFWGTGVLESYRGRGIYGALVRARCQNAQERGAEIVLVTARIGTSGPILKKRGFRVMGSVRMFQGRWAPDAPQ